MVATSLAQIFTNTYQKSLDCNALQLLYHTTPYISVVGFDPIIIMLTTSSLPPSPHILHFLFTPSLLPLGYVANVSLLRRPQCPRHLRVQNPVCHPNRYVFDLLLLFIFFDSFLIFSRFKIRATFKILRSAVVFLRAGRQHL